VLAGQMDDPLDAEVYRARLGRLRHARSTVSVRTPSAHLVSAWYVPAILVYLIDLAGDDAPADHLNSTIARDLGLPPAQVAEVIEKLAGEGYLQFRGRGNVHVSFDRIAASIATKRFLKDVLREAARRIDADFEYRRNFFTSHTFSVSEGDVASLVRDYEALLDRYVAQKGGETPETSGGVDRANPANAEVVVTAFQMFPVLAKKG